MVNKIGRVGGYDPRNLMHKEHQTQKRYQRHNKRKEDTKKQSREDEVETTFNELLKEYMKKGK